MIDVPFFSSAIPSSNTVFRSSWQSQDKKIFDDNEFSEFISFISNQISKSLNSFELDITEMSLDSMWINFQSVNGYSIRNKQSNSSFTGLIWLKVDKGIGNLVFENELTHDTISYYTEDFCLKNNIFNRYSILPEEGKIVIFPSFLPYYFEQNTGESEIISLEFNLNVQ